MILKKPTQKSKLTRSVELGILFDPDENVLHVAVLQADRWFLWLMQLLLDLCHGGIYHMTSEILGIYQSDSVSVASHIHTDEMYLKGLDMGVPHIYG